MEDKMKTLCLQIFGQEEDGIRIMGETYPITVLLQTKDMSISRVSVEKRLNQEQQAAMKALEEAVAGSGAAQLALQAIVTIVWNEAIRMRSD